MPPTKPAPAPLSNLKPSSQQTQKQQATDDYGTDKVPFVVKVISTNHTPEERQRNREKAEIDRQTVHFTRNLANYTDRLFWATVSLSGLTGALAAFLQMREGCKAITAAEDAAKAARASAKSTEDLARSGAEHAGHADRAIELSEAASRRQLRAYVFQSSFDVQPILDHANHVVRWEIRAVWENAGQTPTRNGRCYTNRRDFGPGETPDQIGFPDFGDESPDGLLIGPRGIKFSGTVNINVSNALAAKANGGRIFIWGWFEYDDIYTPITPRHRTEFCVYFVPLGPIDVPIRENVGLRHHATFNNADDDCYREPVSR